MSPRATPYPGKIQFRSKILHDNSLETAMTLQDQLRPGPNGFRPQSRRDALLFPPLKRRGRETPHTLHTQQYLASPRRPDPYHPSLLHPRQHHLGPLQYRTSRLHPGTRRHQISSPIPLPLHQLYLNTPPHSLTTRLLAPSQPSTLLPPPTPVPTPHHPPPRLHPRTVRFGQSQNQTI